MVWVNRWQHCHMASMVVSALLFFSSLGGSYAFSSGSVEVACDSMTPLHGVGPQSTPPPYTVTGVQNPDGSINVRLGSTAADGIFEGFLLQARDSSGKRVGVFSNQPDATQLLNCDFPGGAVSHTDNSKRNSIDVLWQPQGYTGNVQFRATVVRSFATFYTGVTSQNFAIQPVQSGPSGTPQSPENVDASNPSNTFQPPIETRPNPQPQPQPQPPGGLYQPPTQPQQPDNGYQPPFQPQQPGSGYQPPCQPQQPGSGYQPSVQPQPQPPGGQYQAPTQTQPPFVFPSNPSPGIYQPPAGYLPPIG